MGKRKRGAENGQDSVPVVQAAKSNGISSGPTFTQIQIITGSYDKVLHGIVASVYNDPSSNDDASAHVDFRDNFLFNAHGSAIRCLAVSPTSDPVRAPTVTLASGGSDERVNLYQLSASAPEPSALSEVPPLLPGEKKTSQDSKNKELGSLLHHSSSVNALYFPTRSKLLSGADDNTIAVSRSRDWTVLSTFKAPNPKASGRPSGDTAPPGGTPAGINDFAVHPSKKLMISVGKGEKSMRLWNLVTGKKAGVLSFGRETLRAVGEGKWTSGEGRRVTWNAQGDEFAVAFEYGAVIYGMDCRPKFRVVPSPRTKLQQIRFLEGSKKTPDPPGQLVVSTEDGRVLFFSGPVGGTQGPSDAKPDDEDASVPLCHLIGQLGGKALDLTNRVKDFEILVLWTYHGELPDRYVVTVGSDGFIRVWSLPWSMAPYHQPSKHGKEQDEPQNGDGKATDAPATATDVDIPQVGKLLGTYETFNRVTCLKAFVLRSRSKEEEEEDSSEEAWEEGEDGKDRESDGLDDEFNGLESDNQSELGA